MPAKSLEQVVNLCKTRGFVFPGSAAYGGVASFWDYGPLGVEMLNHVKRIWWQESVYARDDMEGLDAAILMSRKVWQHSGHEATFTDPLVDNRETKRRYRLDHLLKRQSAEVLEAICDILKPAPTFTAPSRQATISPDPEALASALIYHYREVQTHFSASTDQMKSENAAILMDVFGLTEDEVRRASADSPVPRADSKMFEPEQRDPLTAAAVLDPADGKPGKWTAPRQFNLMFVTHVGPVEAAPNTPEEIAARAYLRPETAQGIFLNFKNVQRSMARKVPFGIAQMGKAFRNEITPGNFIFRTREFEQMEIEFFIKPPQFTGEGEKTDEQWHEEWIDQRYRWWLRYATPPTAGNVEMEEIEERFRKRAQAADELAHYAKATTDIEYKFPGSLSWGEIEGVANRTDFDLTAHSGDVPEEDLKRLKLEPNKDSNQTFDYFDPDAKQRYVPWVIEPSAGVTRAMLTFLCEAYDEEVVKEPTKQEIDQIKSDAAMIKNNAEKKIKAAEKDAAAGKETKHDPVQVRAFLDQLEDVVNRLPESLDEVLLTLDHPGAENLEPVKKFRVPTEKFMEEVSRTVLRLHPALAPIKLAVFPLKKNKPEIVEMAKGIKRMFQKHFRTVYDDSAGIGRLYRRQDEIGTPYCITVDFESLEDRTVTVRERDTMEQERVAIDDLKDYLFTRLDI
ncbi:MAG: glycine--tRNA ligase [Planctomycetes bacterium]|nr:glycine--tRNA ligase [Planctomycetota bacterium]